MLSFEPLHGEGSCFGHFHLGTYFPSLHQTEGIPNLIVKVTSLFAKGIVEEDVVAGWGREHHTHAHTIGTVLLNQIEWIGAITERLRHLAAELVAHDTGEVNVLERHVAHVLVSGHNHTCHPEEDNIRAGHQVGCRIVVLNLFVSGVFDAVEERDGPQP